MVKNNVCDENKSKFGIKLFSNFRILNHLSHFTTDSRILTIVTPLFNYTLTANKAQQSEEVSLKFLIKGKNAWLRSMRMALMLTGKTIEEI
jgi:hypothetical protein